MQLCKNTIWQMSPLSETKNVHHSMMPVLIQSKLSIQLYGFSKSKHLSPPFEPICHLSSLLLSRLSIPCAVMAQRLIFKCLLPKGHSRACLLITNSPSRFLSPSSPLFSRPSQGRSHALLRAIDLRGRTQNFLSRYFVPVPPFICVYDKYTSPPNIISASSSSIHLGA